MANAIYPKYKQSLLAGDANSDLDSAEGTTGVFAVLVDTGVTAYSAAHQFYSEIAGAVIGTEQEITSKTITDGTFNGSNLTFTSVGPNGTTIEAIVIYRKNAGANTTWRLVAYIDSNVTNLPVTANTGDITVTWNASGIFTL